MVNLREEAGMFSRRVVTEEAPAARRRSRSPVRRRDVKVADAEVSIRRSDCGSDAEWSLGILITYAIAELYRAVDG